MGLVIDSQWEFLAETVVRILFLAWPHWYRNSQLSIFAVRLLSGRNAQIRSHQ